MQENPKHPPDQHPDTQNQNAGGDDGSKVNKKPRVRAWIFWATVAGLLAFFSQYIESFDHRFLFPSLICVLMTVVSSARALWIHLVNNGSDHLSAYRRSGLIVFGGVIACAVMFLLERSPTPPKPCLKLILWKVDSRKVNLELTNASLFSDNNSFDFSGPHPALIVPVNHGKSNVSLLFSLTNSSAVTILNGEVTITCNRRLGFVPNEFWETNMLAEDDKNDESFIKKIPFPILPGNAVGLPNLDFFPPVSHDERTLELWPFGMFLRADGMPPVLFRCWLSFVSSTNISKPRLVIPILSKLDATNHQLILIQKDE